MPSEVEIGIWVEGVQKWVTGVSRRTSCHDIIKALLRAQNLSAQDADVSKYVIVERWRKMERPLDHEQRILKVWKTWGEAVQEVRFSLRRVKGGDDDRSDSDAGSRVERSRRRHKWRQANGAHSKGAVSSSAAHISTATITNKKILQDEDPTVSDTMERLMRLVVAQGETIQTQLRRMHERDQQIESFENQLHQLRVQNLGSDYLLHSYLQEPHQDLTSSPHQENHSFSKDEEKSNDSGVVTEEMPELLAPPPPERRARSSSRDRKLLPKWNGTTSGSTEDFTAKAHLLDRLDDVFSQLLEQEENLAKLEGALAETTHYQLSQLKEEIVTATKDHAKTVASSRQNELQLRELDTVLYQRKLTLESLIEEDEKYEQEVLALQAHLDYIIHLPPTAFKLPNAPQPSSSSSSSSKPPPSSEVEESRFVNPSGKAQQLESANGSLKVVVKPPSADPETSSLKSILRDASPSQTKEVVPPPLPSSSPPPLDEDDDKDSGKTSSLCVSSSSSTSSESSPCQNSPPSSSSSSAVGGGGGIVNIKVAKGGGAHSSKDSDSTDSNSDTGLSSLHSSSDEGAYVLDTLV